MLRQFVINKKQTVVIDIFDRNWFETLFHGLQSAAQIIAQIIPERKPKEIGLGRLAVSKNKRKQLSERSPDM